MATLYEIEQAIMDCVDLETGEIIDIEKLDQLQMDKDVKIENTALFIKNLLSDADQIREEEKKLADRRRAGLEKELAAKSTAIRRLQKDLLEDSRRLSHVAESNPGYSSPSKKSSR